MILERVQAALALAGEMEAVVPGVRRRRVRAAPTQTKRTRTWKARNLPAVLDGGDDHRPSPSRRAVIVAVIHEHAEVEDGGLGPPEQRVADVGRVRSRLHPDASGDERLVARVGPHRRGAVAAEALEREMAGRRDRAASPAVQRQLVRGAAVLDAILDLRDQQRPAERRLERRHEQAVIAAGERARHRSGGEAPDAVGAEPLAPLGGREVARGLAPEVEHQRSRSLSRSPTRSALAMIVNAGFTAALDGKNDASTT